MKSDSELDALVAALRTDLPSERDSARLRTRLSALGLASSQALVGSAAAASATAAPGAALGATEVAVHAGGASWALKAGAIALVSASAVGGPAWFVHDRLTSVPSTASGASVAATARANVASGPQRRAASDAKAALPKARSDGDRGSVRNDRATPALGGELVRPRDSAATAGIPKTGQASPASPANLAAAAEARVQPGSPSTAGFAESEGGFDSALSARAAEPTTLREETALIDRALSALRANDVSRAAALLAEHRSRFPNGLLTQERERAQHKLAEIQRPQGAR